MSEKPPAMRALFLKVRCVYIRELMSLGSAKSAIDAVNIHDGDQARLICMTDPGFGDGTVTRALAAILSEMPAEERPQDPELERVKLALQRYDDDMRFRERAGVAGVVEAVVQERNEERSRREALERVAQAAAESIAMRGNQQARTPLHDALAAYYQLVHEQSNPAPSTEQSAVPIASFELDEKCPSCGSHDPPSLEARPGDDAFHGTGLEAELAACGSGSKEDLVEPNVCPAIDRFSDLGCLLPPGHAGEHRYIKLPNNKGERISCSLTERDKKLARELNELAWRCYSERGSFNDRVYADNATASAFVLARSEAMARIEELEHALHIERVAIGHYEKQIAANARTIAGMEERLKAYEKLEQCAQELCKALSSAISDETTAERGR